MVMRRSGLPSLKDVAKAAGVSVTTVSRHINGMLVLPAETAQRIAEAVRALDYRPNPHARRLSLGRSETIGLVVPDIANPFFARLVAAVEQVADENGLGVSLFASLNRAGRELVYLDHLRRNHVDGLIFVTNHFDDGTLARQVNLARNVVILDEDVPGADVPKVFCDNERGGYLAGRHLIEAGHRRIAFISGPPGMISTRERSKGLHRAISEAGGDHAVVATFHGEYTIEYGRTAAHRFLADRSGATALFASSDEMLIGCLEILRPAGIRIPFDLSVIGFDDVGPLHLFDPPVTAIRQPVAALGRRAVELLVDRARRDPDHRTSSHRQDHDAAVVERLPVEIVVRSSVAPPAKPARSGRKSSAG
jgi:LacI family transcriptional regulator